MKTIEALIALGSALLLGAFEGVLSGTIFTAAYYSVNDRWAWGVFWLFFTIAAIWEFVKSLFAVFAGSVGSQPKE